MPYRPEIDGLRAVAVLLVILFHVGSRWFPGGYIGVDVFFVISGYLITALIRNDLEAGRFSLTEFYIRRARRILPALFLVMLVCLPLAFVFLLPNEFAHFGRYFLATSVFMANFAFWRGPDYFRPVNEENPLIHMWSLAVEEQFYLFYPLVLLGLWHFLRRRGGRPQPSLIVWLCLGAVASFGFAIWAEAAMPKANFFLLPSRAWELLAGALCTFVPAGTLARLPRAVSEALAIIGVAMILAAAAIYTKETPFPSHYALLPVFGSALVILFARPTTWTGRMLSLRGIVFLGLLSYSAYLWHQPIFAFARVSLYGELPTLTAIGLVGLTFLLAAATRYLVENPVRYGKVPMLRAPRHIFGASAAAMAVFAAAGGVIHASDGFKDRYDRINVLGYDWNNEQLKQQSWSILREISDEPDYGTERNAYDRIARFEPTDSRENLLLIGNSHSKDLFNIFLHSERIEAGYELARFGTQVADAAASPDLFQSSLFQSASIVVIDTRYSNEDIAALPDLLGKLKLEGKRIAVVTNTPNFPATDRKTLADNRIAPFLFSRPSSAREAEARELAESINREYWRTPAHKAWVDRTNAQIAEIARAEGVTLLDRRELLCDAEAEICLAVSDVLGKHFYDYGHITLHGAKAFARRLDEIDWFRSPK